MHLKPLCQALALPEGQWTHEHDRSRLHSLRGVAPVWDEQQRCLCMWLVHSVQTVLGALMPSLCPPMHAAVGTPILGDP